jgi:hypothetical protein
MLAANQKALAGWSVLVIQQLGLQLSGANPTAPRQPRQPDNIQPTATGLDE